MQEEHQRDGKKQRSSGKPWRTMAGARQRERESGSGREKVRAAYGNHPCRKTSRVWKVHDEKRSLSEHLSFDWKQSARFCKLLLNAEATTPFPRPGASAVLEPKVRIQELPAGGGGEKGEGTCRKVAAPPGRRTDGSHKKTSCPTYAPSTNATRKQQQAASKHLKLQRILGARVGR